MREKFGFDNIRKLVNYFKFNEFDEGGVEVKLDKIFMGGRASRQKGFDRVLSKDTSLEIDFYSDNAGNYNNIVNSNINVHDRLATIDEMKMYKYCFMPSRYEGLPLLAIEMILNGTIVCHSGCEGMQEVFSEFYSIYKIDFDSCDFDKKFSRKENEMESKFILLRKSVKERFVVDDRFSLNRFKLVFDV